MATRAMAIEKANNNQPATGLTKAGGGWRESINQGDRMTTMVGNNKQQECVADDDGSNKKGKGGKGDGDGNEGGG
jgi:hypothetical protein